jgi:hypothetical protein
MATVAVYPRLGTEYDDAAGVPITSAGAIVDVSKYILDALKRGYLLDWDPLDIFQPDDRTGTTVPGGGVASFATAALLGATRGSTANQMSLSTGCLSQGDGGGGEWYWDPSDASTPANVGTVLGTGTGRWKRLYNDPIHSSWFGTVGDGEADDTAALQAFIDAIPVGGSGFIDPGVYRIASPLYVDANEVQITAAPSSLVAQGVKLVWDGAADDVYAVYLSGYAQNIVGVNITADSALFGGFHVGFFTGHTTVINSRCQFKDCSVLAYPNVGDAPIQFGFGVATVEVGGNQDFNYFENCFVQHCEQAGWWIKGAPNCIQTTLRRCVIINTLGQPGHRKYVELGMSDDVLHSYGIGVRVDDANGVDIDGINFGYLETGFKRSGPDGSASTAVNYDRICNIDSEQCKKIFYYKTHGTLGTLAIEGGRISSFNIGVRSIGPDGPDGEGFEASDHAFAYFSGPTVMMTNVGFHVGDNSVKFDGSIVLDLGMLTAIGCTFPSNKPFAGDSVARIVSWGNFGPDGGSPSAGYSRVLDGAYRVQAGGFLDSVHFDVLQSYSKVNLYTPDTITPVAPNEASGSAGNYARSSSGTVTISGAATSATATLNTNEQNNTYVVLLTPVSITGAPAAGSYAAIAINKTTSQFDAVVPTAPGVGSSITFRYQMANDANL